MFNWQDDPWREFETIGNSVGPRSDPQTPQPLIQRPRTAPLPARDALGVAETEQQMQARGMGMETEQMRQQNLGLDIQYNAERNRQQQLGRPLSPSEADTLRETTGVFRSLRNARNNFRDEYSGLLAGVENRLGELNTNWADPGQRDWWAEFRRSDVGERNQLFGASLQPNEQAAFAETTIGTQMDPRAIRENVGRRYEAARLSLMRQREFLIANGFRPDAVDALIGEDLLAEFNIPQAGEQQQRPGQQPQQRQQEQTLAPPPVSDVDRSSLHSARGGPPGTRLSEGGTRIERDPALRGVNRRVSNMMVRGAPDEEIRSYVNEVAPEALSNLDRALEFRRDRRRWDLWRRQNPRAGYPVEIEMREVPMTTGQEVMSRLSRSPLGAYGVAAGNALTGQRLDQVVGALGGDQELARAGIEQVRHENPASSFLGDVSAGTMMAMGGTAALGRAGVSGLPAMLGTEGAIGAYQGQGLNRDNPLMGAATGGALGVAGGAVMRTGTGLGARAVAPTGGRLAPLYAEGVQPSIGQRMGGLPNRAEDAMASVPYVGAAQRSNRQQAQDAAERGVFNRALRNIPPSRSPSGTAPQLPRDVGPGPQAWQHTYDTFDNAYNSVHAQMTFRLDNRVQQSLVQAQQNARRLSTDSASRFERIFADDVIRPLSQNNGTLTGQQLQSVLSNLRTTVRNVRKNQNGDPEFADALEGLEDALMRGAVRNSPREAIRDLRRIDRGYAQLMRAERAALSGSANREPGRFSANDMLRAERQQGSRRRFLRGEQEGAQYASAWNQLGRAVGDSGTGERLGYLAAGTGMWGGAGAGVQLLDPLMASPLIANTVANLPGVRRGVNLALDPGRAGPHARHIRDAMMRNRGIMGGGGAAAAPQFLLGDPYY